MSVGLLSCQRSRASPINVRILGWRLSRTSVGRPPAAGMTTYVSLSRVSTMCDLVLNSLQPEDNYIAQSLRPGCLTSLPLPPTRWSTDDIAKERSTRYASRSARTDDSREGSFAIACSEKLEDIVVHHIFVIVSLYQAVCVRSFTGPVVLQDIFRIFAALHGVPVSSWPAIPLRIPIPLCLPLGSLR